MKGRPRGKKTGNAYKPPKFFKGSPKVKHTAMKRMSNKMNAKRKRGPDG